mgnify:FL=1
MKRQFLFELMKDDIGGLSNAITRHGPSVGLKLIETMGTILACDVGKRAYLVGDVVQVENAAQRAARNEAVPR